MSYPVGFIEVWKNKHRMYHQVYAFNVLSACIGYALCRVMERNHPYDTLDRGSFSCSQFNREIHFPMKNVVETIAYNASTFGITLAVTETVKPTGKLALETGSLNPVMTHVIGPIFTDFFENYRPWLEENVSTDAYQWPTIWNFGRVVRNAASHGGCVNWKNDRALPVQWHHISYSKADRGRQIICGHLDVGDLFLLMLEMNDELDALGCPVL